MSSCINWEHGRNRDGYGECRYEGRKHLAHRVAYAKHHGLRMADIAGQVVRHTCDNPACINPAHLVIGSQADNMRDMKERGRRANFSGEKHGCAKLTRQQVKQIRDRYVPGCKINGGAALAREFGITKTHANRIATGSSWSTA